MQLLIATKNPGKIREFQRLLAETPIVLRSLNEFPEIAEPLETGATFAENASVKAKYYAALTNLPTLADDSGLEVEALGGAPGVFSARYAGEKATDREKVEKLLGALGETNDANRSARFVCAIAVGDGTGGILFETAGVCDGKIAFKPSGTNGFGYDSIFIPRGYAETFGDIPASIKQQISHRARAVNNLTGFLRGLVAA